MIGDEPRSRTIALSLERPPRGSTLALIALRPSRSMIHSVEVIVDGVPPPTVGVSGWVVAAHWRESLTGMERVGLRVRFSGEPVDVIRVEWRGAIVDGLVEWSDAKREEELAPALEREARRYRHRLLDEERRMEPEPVPGIARSKEYRQYFMDFDFETNVHLFSDNPSSPPPQDHTLEQRERAVDSVGTLVRQRPQFRRFTGTPQRSARYVRDAENAVSDEDVRLLADLQMHVLEVQPVFQDGSGLAWERIDEAYHLFGAGHLDRTKSDSTGLHNARPDGPNMLYFAEFALLVIDRKVPDPEARWPRLLTSLVRMQTLFLRACPSLEPGAKEPLTPLPLPEIEACVERFDRCARAHGVEWLHWQNIRRRYGLRDRNDEPTCEG